jgi:hypothetical protein
VIVLAEIGDKRDHLFARQFFPLNCGVKIFEVKKASYPKAPALSSRGASLE